MMYSVFGVVLSSIVLLAQPSVAQTTGKNSTVVFSVNNKPVTAEEFIYLYSKNNQGRKEEFTKEKIEEYVDLLVNFKLKVEEARARGMDTTEAFLKEYNGYREELRKPYLPDSKLIDSLVTLTYNRLREEVRASHILIRLTADAAPSDTLKAFEKAMALRKRIVEGEDFGQVAREASEDETAKINAGDLGYFTAMQMVFPFENGAFTTPVGSVSMPVRTSFGYHLIKVVDRRPSRGEVEVAHIMLRTGEAHDNDKARNTIFEIFDKLQKGMPWDDLVKEYSEDPSSKGNGGKLRPFGSGAMAGVPQFEAAAFGLENPGDLSDPVQTQFGWHIIKLIRKIPLPSFDEMQSSLRNRVSRDQRAQISRDAAQAKLRREFGFRENDEAKVAAISEADSSLMKGLWKRPDVPAQTLFALGNKEYSTREFFDYVQRKQKPSALAPDRLMRQLYDQYVADVQGLLLEERIKRNNPDYAYLLNEYYEGILLFEIMEKEVWNKASSDSVGQRRFFEANRARYTAGERVLATLYSSGEAATMDMLETALSAGDSLKLQALVTEKKVRHEKGRFEKDDRPVLGKVPWSPGVHRSENNGLAYVVKIEQLVPPGPKTFEEARASVISDYQTELEKLWLAQLRKKHTVRVNKKGKQYVMKTLIENNR